MSVYLSFCECPLHGYKSISVDTENHGLRLTPQKCCGRWDIVKQWPVTAATLRDALEFAEQEEVK